MTRAAKHSLVFVAYIASMASAVLAPGGCSMPVGDSETDASAPERTGSAKGAMDCPGCPPSSDAGSPDADAGSPDAGAGSPDAGAGGIGGSSGSSSAIASSGAGLASGGLGSGAGSGEGSGGAGSCDSTSEAGCVGKSPGDECSVHAGDPDGTCAGQDRCFCSPPVGSCNCGCNMTAQGGYFWYCNSSDCNGGSCGMAGVTCDASHLGHRFGVCN
jgi:hypothetical protein